MPDPAKQSWNKTYKTRKMVAALDFTQKALTFLSSKPGCSLLDVGCGDGRDAQYFARQDIAVTAIDFSEEAIKRVQSEDPSISARVMDILHMDFPDESFDAIYAHLSLHYFDDAATRSVFKNIHRMLKPGGFFFVKCKSTSDPLYGKGERIGKDMFFHEHTRHFFSKEYMAENLQDFEIISLEETSSSYDGKNSAFVEAVARKK